MGANTRRKFLELTGVSAVTIIAGCGGTEGGQPTNGGEEEILVGADGSTRFEPEETEITAGTTVEFVWDSDGHTLMIRQQPEDSDWSRSPTNHNEGHTVSHTFDVPGEYVVYCSQHGGDMEATIIVDGD